MNRLLSTIWSAVTGKPQRSPRWRAVRKAFLAGKTCAACGCDEYLEAHHILPVAYYPEHELDNRFLLALCDHPARRCHLNIGHAGDYKAFNPRCIEDAALMLKRRQNRVYRRLEVVN